MSDEIFIRMTGFQQRIVLGTITRYYSLNSDIVHKLRARVQSRSFIGGILLPKREWESVSEALEKERDIPVRAMPPDINNAFHLFVQQRNELADSINDIIKEKIG